ncbi:MAG: C10 family peptidase [Prevotella sp.]|nr:C10 family peptidase [Prevotella sp.]
MNNLNHYHFRLLLGSILLVFGLMPRHAVAQDVEPILRTQWGQGAPYNMYCPEDGYAHALAGCGPVAMAQVICAMQYPSKSPRDNMFYNWQRMPERLTAVSALVEQNDVARLIADCGVTAFTNYGVQASSTSVYHIVNAMKKLFGYSRYMMVVDRSIFPGIEGARLWRDMMFGELRAGRCVIVRGKKSVQNDNGHIFVVDGLRDTMVHVNFGWAGKCDGWYPVDHLWEYTEGVKMVVNMGDSTYVPPRVSVRVDRPGSLRGCLSDMEWSFLQCLRVEGPINADDIAWLRHLAGKRLAAGQGGHLALLDLSGAKMDSLPDGAFKRAGSLVKVSLPEGLQVIGIDAFRECFNLNDVDIPSSVWKIRMGAFSQCRNLIDIYIPEGVRNLLSFTFSDCSNLTSVRLPESIDTLGYRVFERCARLEYLRIPARTNCIGIQLTDRCPNVRVEVDSCNTMFSSVDGRLEGITKEARRMLDSHSVPRTEPGGKTLLPVSPDGKVVSRYKMVNGKRVFVGFVNSKGQLMSRSKRK